MTIEEYQRICGRIARKAIRYAAEKVADEELLVFGHSASRFFGSIAIERRCDCCGHVVERRTLSRTDLP